MSSLEEIQEKFDICQNGNEFEIASILKDMNNGAKMSFDMKDGFNFWYKFNACDIAILFNKINPLLKEKNHSPLTTEDLRFYYGYLESVYRNK